MTLNFLPLPDAKGIMNAVVPVNHHFRLSVSYSELGAVRHVGSIKDYQAAIQVGITGGKYWSLVDDEETRTNVYRHRTEDSLEALIEKALGLEFGGTIEVFDRFRGSKLKNWGLKFYFAKGYDFDHKYSYAQDTWGEGGYRVLNAEESKIYV